MKSYYKPTNSVLELEKAAEDALETMGRWRKALEFYANNKNYTMEVRAFDDMKYHASNVSEDRGEIARAALSPLPELRPQETEVKDDPKS